MQSNVAVVRTLVHAVDVTELRACGPLVQCTLAPSLTQAALTGGQ
jgi:hypothetical protein